jgi:hypothetical protein
VRQRTHGLRCRCARTGHGNHRRRIWPFTPETPLPVSRTNSSNDPGPRSRNLLLSKSGRPIGRIEDGAAAVSPSTPQIGRHAYVHLPSHAITTPEFPKRTAQARGPSSSSSVSAQSAGSALEGVRADAMAILRLSWGVPVS